MENPSESTPGENQLVVHENVAANNEPAAKSNPDRLTLSVSTLNPAGKLTAEREASALVLRHTIYDEALARKPSVFHANLVAFVVDVPCFHSANDVMPPNDKVSYHADNAGGAHGKDTNDK